MNMIIKLKPLVLLLLLPIFSASLCAAFCGNMPAAYQSFILPAFAVPAKIFPSLWLGLYLLMGFASYLVYTHPKISRAQRNYTLLPYFLQLALAFFWGIFFFCFHLHYLALAVLLGIMALTISCMKRFFVISQTACVLMAVYLLWLIYTVVLFAAILLLN